VAGKRGRAVLFADFGGGVNKDAGPYLLSEKECRDALNVQAGQRGAIRKRNGHLGISTPDVALTSLFGSTNPTRLLGAGGVKVFAIDPAGVDTDITGAVGLTNNALMEWIQAPASGGQGPLYAMNGSQAVHWTGAGNIAAWTASAGTLPVGKYLVYQENRVFAAGFAAMPGYVNVKDPASAVAYSDPGDPRNWPAANFVEFSPNDGEAISGIGQIGPYVLVFKPSRAWVIYDTDTGANRALLENIGCVAHRSIVESEDGAYFLSRELGVYRTDGSTVKRVRETIQPVFESIVQANRHLAAGVQFGGHYYLSVSLAGAANSVLLDYDRDLDSWWIHSTPFTQLALWTPSGATELHGAVPAVTRTDRLFVPGRTQDAGDTNYPAYWIGPHLVFGEPSKRKRARAIHFDGRGRLEVSVAKDFATSQTLEGLADFVTTGEGSFGVDPAGQFGVDDGAVYGGAAVVNEQMLSNLGIGRAWSVMFGITSADEMEVDSMTFYLGERKD
jgi:hypothetical protein